MAARTYKSQKRGGTGKHVQLPEWLQASEAWATMKPGPRALYVELKRRFTGSNNGYIRMSHREAASALNVHRNTVGAMFAKLQRRGFIRMATGPCLGPTGIGKTADWALDELPTSNGGLAEKRFARWTQNQNPRTKSVTPRHNSCGRGLPK